MNSALNPREIQARIRRGESIEDVARESGVPADQVEPFAGPVLAEREHQAAVALSSPVRRRGETGSLRTLRTVVADRLLSRGIDADAVQWDSWRDEDRSWTVVGRYQSGRTPHEALFRFDQRARFSTARNDEARWLIGETGRDHDPQPGDRRLGADPDAEPTVDLKDEMVLAKVTQDAAEMTVPLPRQHRQHPEPADASSPDEEQPGEVDPGRADEPAAAPDRVGDADYVDADLEEVDGVYDFVPGPPGGLDTLYDMLSSFNEDSVNIYEGLSTPPATEAESGQEPATERASDPAGDTPSREVEITVEAHEIIRTPAPSARPADDEPQQDPLLPGDTVPAPARKKSHKRAQVPSWDEIMFGAPRKK